MFELCNKEKQLTIIVNNLINIDEISKDWEMSKDERR
jgi:hypothetical protein